VAWKAMSNSFGENGGEYGPNVTAIVANSQPTRARCGL
jgi:hypothetical protein